MQKMKRLMQGSFRNGVAVLAVILFAGCQSSQEPSRDPAAKTTTTTVASTPRAAAPAPAVAPAPAPNPKAVRIKAGPSAAFKDAEGNAWLPEQGFVDGETTERPDLQIANTKTPVIYLSERYNMTSFSHPVPNGQYTVKLHFAETYDGITGPGQRVFSFRVEGQEFKDFDIWIKAGGPLRAYIETVNVEVTDGKVDISFTPKVEYPQINGIEIIPKS
jgi:hypothetical protein